MYGPWGSRIIFAGPSKISAQANREQQSESNHGVYSHNVGEQLLEPTDCVEKKEIRFDSKCKIKTSFFSSPIQDKILQEMGIEPDYDLEKLVDELNFFENFVIDDAKRKLKSGEWSCLVLAAKSKLMDDTIPRNKLSAILWCTELDILV